MAEIVGRDGNFVSEIAALPVFEVGDARIFQGDVGLLPLLSEEGDRDDGQFRVGTPFQDGRGGSGGDVDIARDEELEVLTTACVSYFDIEVLVSEVSHLLRYVCGDEGQVGLRLEARHEDDLVGGGFYIVIAAGDGNDKCGEQEQEEDASHGPNSTRLGAAYAERKRWSPVFGVGCIRQMCVPGIHPLRSPRPLR